jgi:hypothetical protein
MISKDYAKPSNERLGTLKGTRAALAARRVVMRDDIAARRPQASAAPLPQCRLPRGAPDTQPIANAR